MLYDKLYLFGGFTGTGFLTAVERGTISQTGELSGFGADSISTLVEGLENGVTLQIRDQAIYYVGGYNNRNTSGVPRVQKAVILRNRAPTDIALSGASVAENSASGTPVGNFLTNDADAGNTVTYALVSGAGGADNASFTIVGAQLRTAASFDFETKNFYTIRVRSTDQGGLSFEKQFTVTVTDVA